ncbi:MAG: hypothetical protein ACTHKX_00395 [Pseudolysinimonas sp.]
MSLPDAAPVFVEPTRRYAYSPRITYEGRYGASLVAMVLGGYLLVVSNVSQLAIGLAGLASYPAQQTALFLMQYRFAIAVVVFGLAVAPGALGRRVIAIVVVLVLILIWTLIFMARLTGSVPLPYASGVITAPAFIVALALPAGWLIVRERPGVSYLFLLASILAGLVPFLFVLAAAPVGVTQWTMAPLALIVGVGIAWAARAVAALVQSRHARSGLVDPPLPEG